MHNTFRILLDALMTGTQLSNVNEHVRVVHMCVKRGRPVYIAAGGTVTDGIKTESKVKVKRGGPVSVAAEGTATDRIKDNNRARSFVRDTEQIAIEEIPRSRVADA
jgi:hypothetical protein